MIGPALILWLHFHRHVMWRDDMVKWMKAEQARLHEENCDFWRKKLSEARYGGERWMAIATLLPSLDCEITP